LKLAGPTLSSLSKESNPLKYKTDPSIELLVWSTKTLFTWSKNLFFVLLTSNLEILGSGSIVIGNSPKKSYPSSWTLAKYSPAVDVEILIS